MEDNQDCPRALEKKASFKKTGDSRFLKQLNVELQCSPADAPLEGTRESQKHTSPRTLVRDSVHSHSVHSDQKAERTQMSKDRRVDKHDGAGSYRGVVFGHEKE